jgi:hypothetical protein
VLPDRAERGCATKALISVRVTAGASSAPPVIRLRLLTDEPAGHTARTGRDQTIRTPTKVVIVTAARP